MERDIRYLYVGVVMALLVAAFIAFLLWQAERHAEVEGARYTVFVEGSVSGLGSGSVVRYLGVRAGRVNDIRLSNEDAGRVEVDITVREGVPVSRSTIARIRAEGITGGSYVSLRTPDPGAGRPEAAAGARYPVIRAESSGFEELMDEAPQLVKRLNRVAENMGRVLDETNRRNFARMLEDGQSFTARLDGLAGSMEQLTSRVSRSLDTVDGAMVEIEAAGAQLAPTLSDLRDTSQSLGGLSERVDALIAENESTLEWFGQVGLFEASRLLRDTRTAVNEIEQLARRLNDDPSSLIHRRGEGGLEVPR